VWFREPKHEPPGGLSTMRKLGKPFISILCANCVPDFRGYSIS
jgi:hypothetical protein